MVEIQVLVSETTRDQLVRRKELQERMLGRWLDFRTVAGDLLTKKVRNYTIHE